MKYLILVFLILTLSFASAQMPEISHNSIDMRRNRMLQYYSALDTKKTGFTQIASRLRLGLEVERCQKDFTTLLENPSGDMFYSMPMMAGYLYGWAYWTPEIHAKARNVWKTYLPYRGDTENHWVMWHTALLLAAQTWPDLPGSEWANGRTSRENYDDAAGFLNSWFKTTTTIGQGEFDSPDYLNVYLGSLFTLYNFVKDPVLKQHVEMALNWLLADYAIDYLDGAYTGGHSRIYERAIFDPLRDNAVGFAYLFFGNTPFPRRAPLSFSVLGALTSYQMPEIIQKIATDRSKPYINRERKRVRNVIRFGEEMNPPVYKYNYMTNNYSLGSLNGGLQQPIQIHTWSVTYPYDYGKADNLFSLHPYYSDRELGMFFPEKLKVMVSEVVKSKGTYNKEDKWTGGSPYERTFQHKNAIIVLYDLAEDTHYKHIDYYFPKSLNKKEEDDSGWIFAQGGGAYIAVRPFKPGNWRDEETCNRLSSPHLKNGLITEVADSSDYPSWNKFKKKILETKVDLSKLDSDVEASYVTTAGDKMTFRFPDHRMLNNKKIDLTGTPLFASPYLNGNDGMLKMNYGSEEMVVDFNKDLITKRVKEK